MSLAITPAPVDTLPAQQLPADSAAQSIFTGHSLSPRNDKPVIHQTSYDYVIAAVLLGAFILFVWIYVSNKKRLGQIIRAFYIGRYANQLAREEVSFVNRVSVFLFVLFIVTFTIFLNQVNAYYGFYQVRPGAAPFIVTGSVLVLGYLMKIVLMRFLGTVFQTQKEISEYMQALMLFGCALGLFLMPVVICLAFARQADPRIFIIAGMAVTAVFLCIRMARGVVIGLNSVRVSRFYLFLYLCTLEILPLVVLAKLFMLRD